MIAVLRSGVEESYGDDLKLTLVFGAVYRFKGLLGPPNDGKRKWTHPPCTVRLICLARHVHSGQEIVAYEILDGCEQGDNLACTLSDWANNFEAPKPDPPAPPKVLDTREKGGGY